MRQISLREFRTRGAKVLEEVPANETILLSGQDGPTYFLVPVIGDISAEDKGLQEVLAQASLRENWRLAQESEPLTMEEIDEEIAKSRLSHKKRKKA